MQVSQVAKSPMCPSVHLNWSELTGNVEYFANKRNLKGGGGGLRLKQAIVENLAAQRRRSWSSRGGWEKRGKWKLWKCKRTIFLHPFFPIRQPPTCHWIIVFCIPPVCQCKIQTNTYSYMHMNCILNFIPIHLNSKKIMQGYSYVPVRHTCCTWLISWRSVHPLAQCSEWSSFAQTTRKLWEGEGFRLAAYNYNPTNCHKVPLWKRYSTSVLFLVQPLCTLYLHKYFY